MTPDTLITNCLLPADDGKSPSTGFISIRNGMITAMGNMTDCPSAGNADVIEAAGLLAMPGLVNGHCHAAMTLFRGLADDLTLHEWLNDHIFPAEAAHVNPEMVYWCSKLAAAEMLLAGTTTVADGYFYADEVARAFHDAGIRAVTAQGVIDFPVPGVPDPERNIEAAAAVIEKLQGKYPLVSPAIFAHAPYTCSAKTLIKAKELADNSGVPLFIHLAETENEHSLINAPEGPSPVRHLEALGTLDRGTICVHCVWVDDNDLDILAANDCSIITCPQSNLKLSSGIAPLPKMLERNIRVGLGTDGTASNNTLDMFREMDTCAKIQKLHNLDPTAAPAGTVLEMGTHRGAQALGLPGTIGTLSPGSAADLILVDLQQPHFQPFYSRDTLVYSGSGGDVHSVLVQGKLVVRESRLLSFDLEETMEMVRSLSKKLLSG